MRAYDRKLYRQITGKHTLSNFTVKQQTVMLYFCKTCFCRLTKRLFPAIIVLSKKRRKYNVLQGNSVGGRGEIIRRE